MRNERQSSQEWCYISRYTHGHPYLALALHSFAAFHALAAFLHATLALTLAISSLCFTSNKEMATKNKSNVR